MYSFPFLPPSTVCSICLSKFDAQTALFTLRTRAQHCRVPKGTSSQPCRYVNLAFVTCGGVHVDSPFSFFFFIPSLFIYLCYAFVTSRRIYSPCPATEAQVI
uniref:Uncharacterized protein n=1 Tax=Trypanosoma vivax (strain Y486) TaxID=1055687 RepID=G0TW99_TRYVY|nr:hypothetical protein TVY486_0600280 [Trypanosoma vivax Y486]